jgi:hypothetical protein
VAPSLSLLLFIVLTCATGAALTAGLATALFMIMVAVCVGAEKDKDLLEKCAFGWARGWRHGAFFSLRRRRSPTRPDLAWVDREVAFCKTKTHVCIADGDL